MKSLTRKEAREQFEFLMAMDRLLRVIDGPRGTRFPKIAVRGTCRKPKKAGAQ